MSAGETRRTSRRSAPSSAGSPWTTSPPTARPQRRPGRGWAQPGFAAGFADDGGAPLRVERVRTSERRANRRGPRRHPRQRERVRRRRHGRCANRRGARGRCPRGWRERRVDSRGNTRVVPAGVFARASIPSSAPPSATAPSVPSPQRTAVGRMDTVPGAQGVGPRRARRSSRRGGAGSFFGRAIQTIFWSRC